MIIHNPPTAYYIGMALLMTVISQKLNVLPQWLTFNGFGYLAILVTLVILALIPVAKRVSYEHDYQKNNK